MIKGINVDPAHGFSVEEIASLNVSVVRTAPWQDNEFDYNHWAQALQAAGIEPMWVLDQRALDRPRGFTYYQAIRRLANKYPTVKYWEIGNEPDLESDSSSTMDPKDFTSLLIAAAEALPDKHRVSGGLVGGDPSWASKVGVWPVQGIGLHPYGQKPQGWDVDWGFGLVDDLIGLYDSITSGKELWITEWGIPVNEVSEEERAAYTSLMQIDLGGIAHAALIFCYSDLMGPFGLLKGDGSPYLACAAFRDS